MSLSLVVFASGEGTNAEALMELAAREPKLIQVRGLLSDRSDALALGKAKQRGIAAHYIPQGEEARVLEVLRLCRPDWACLAGYMRIIKKPILDFFHDTQRGFSRILNIHPSLLPAFPGLRAYDQAFHAGVRESGVTVHIVDEKLDHGPIVAQKKFPRLAADSLESFTARGRALENDLYVEAVKAVASGRFSLLAQEKKESGDE